MKTIALALIEAASWLEQHDGDWNVDVRDYGDDISITLSRWVHEAYDYDRNETVSGVDRMAAMRREIGGKWDKYTSSYEFALTHAVSDTLTIRLSVSRDAACTPRVVGEETVEVVDYDTAPKKMVTRDIVEYDCNPILDTPKDEMDNSVEESARKARVTPSGIEE